MLKVASNIPVRNSFPFRWFLISLKFHEKDKIGAIFSKHKVEDNL
jgi:hypothetical protein